MERDLKIKDSVRRLYDARQKKKQVDNYTSEVNRKESLYIRNYMFSNCSDKSFEIELDEGEEYYINPIKVKVQEVRTKKVNWFLSKMKQALTKKQYNSVVDKQYMIVDMPGLIEYLKSCGASAKTFKSFISVQETVNEAKLEKAYDLGDIKRKQLDGCYEVVEGSPYVKITEIKQ